MARLVVGRAAAALVACTLPRAAPAVLTFRRSWGDPYSQVSAQPVEVGAAAEAGGGLGGEDAAVDDSGEASSAAAEIRAGASRKFLIASFPLMRQVAYAHLPDNVWRPLVVGEVSSPGGIAADTQRGRLFVADQGRRAIWWYELGIDPHGFLQTVGPQRAAVEDVEASWLAVNSVGDLYFTGRLAGDQDSPPSVWRHDAASISRGRSRDPTEVYTRFNSGAAAPKVWNATGVAADSLYVYWGNGAEGGTHGSVVRGSRENIGLLSQERQMGALSTVAEDVRGVTATGTHIFFLSSAGLHGVLKGAEAVGLAGAAPRPGAAGKPAGLVAARPDPGSGPWDPVGIAWDGDNTLFFTDALNGTIYRVPSLNVLQHNLTRFAEAPGVHGVAFIGFGSAAAHSGAGPAAFPRLTTAAAAVFAVAGSVSAAGALVS